MKKVILVVFAALLLAAPAVQAQKVNKAAWTEKINKSDADIADAKKATKAATWMSRGKLFYEVANEPTKNLYAGGLNAQMLPVVLGGQPKAKGEATVGNDTFETWEYPFLTLYLKDGNLYTWEQTRYIFKNAIGKAFEAYSKAYELDPKTAPKVKEGLQQLIDYSKQSGDSWYKAGKYVQAAKAYAQVYEIQKHPAYNKPEAVMLYNAGLLMTFDGANNADSYKKGAKYLTTALNDGFSDEEGKIYYYLFHCYYGQRTENPAMLQKAKQSLLDGIAKYPKNELILEGLMQLYTSEEGMGDPADLIELIDKAIADNPTNVDLWFGRGRIFYALKNYDESIASFEKVAELQPDLFDGHFYSGVFYTIKGDAENKIFNDRSYTRQSEYDADLAKVNAVYMKAVPCFEKALALKADDPDTLEYLKSLCFRLRDEPGMMEKYTTYNAQFKKVKGLE